MHLTETQWEILKPFFPDPPGRADRRGHPWHPSRPVLEGVLWVLKSGARWRDLPRREYIPYQTCHRRFQAWVRDGTLLRAAAALADAAGLDLREAFVDATFAPAKKGAAASVKQSAARAPRS